MCTGNHVTLNMEDFSWRESATAKTIKGDEYNPDVLFAELKNLLSLWYVIKHESVQIIFRFQEMEQMAFVSVCSKYSHSPISEASSA